MENEEFDTVVGEDVELNGSIKNTGSILINGVAKGDVISDQSVVIGNNARVEGPISAKSVQVSGEVDGSINAEETLELLPESQVSGDIKAGTLHIQPGAVFNGTSSMGNDNKKEEKEENNKGKIAKNTKKRKPKLEIEN